MDGGRISFKPLRNFLKVRHGPAPFAAIPYRSGRADCCLKSKCQAIETRNEDAASPVARRDVADDGLGDPVPGGYRPPGARRRRFRPRQRVINKRSDIPRREATPRVREFQSTVIKMAPASDAGGQVCIAWCMLF